MATREMGSTATASHNQLCLTAHRVEDVVLTFVKQTLSHLNVLFRKKGERSIKCQSHIYIVGTTSTFTTRLLIWVWLPCVELKLPARQRAHYLLKTLIKVTCIIIIIFFNYEISAASPPQLTRKL